MLPLSPTLTSPFFRRNQICHKQLTATGPDGKTVSVLVTDRCAGCAPGSIDLTPTAFQQLASLDVGRLHGVTWTLAA